MIELQQVKEYVEESPDLLFYQWSGILFSEQDFFTRLDKTFLYSVYTTEQGAVFQSNIGYVRYNEVGEPYVYVSNEPAYKIMSGNRSGRIVPLDKVFENERVTQINQPKPLVSSKDPTKGFSYALPEDKRYLAVLQQLEKEGDEYDYEGWHTPELYLSCSKHNDYVYPRNIGSAAAYLKASRGYDAMLNMRDNTVNLLSELERPAGKNRVAYPFEHFYGKGVIVADTSIFGEWYSVDHCAETELSELTINFEF